MIDTGGDHHYPINGGKTERYHALARPEAAGPNGHVLISIFQGDALRVPAEALRWSSAIRSAARPSSRCRRALSWSSSADDEDGIPARRMPSSPQPGQGVNYPRNTWHGVLTPIGEPQDFLIVDRGGDGNNLEEFYFPEPYEIHLPED